MSDFADLRIEERNILSRCKMFGKLKNASQKQVNFFNVMVKSKEFEFPIDLLLRWGYIPSDCHASVKFMIRKLLLNAENFNYDADNLLNALGMICGHPESSKSLIKIIQELIAEQGCSDFWSFMEGVDISKGQRFLDFVIKAAEYDLALTGMHIYLSNKDQNI